LIQYVLPAFVLNQALERKSGKAILKLVMLLEYNYVRRSFCSDKTKKEGACFTVSAETSISTLDLKQVQNS